MNAGANDSPHGKLSQMTTASKAPKAPKVIITSPKIVTAWNKVCSTSSKSETSTIEAIESLSATMTLESRLSVRDIKKVITETGSTNSAVSVSQVEALLTWSKLRAKFAEFRALPLAKQLSTASASYSLIGAGKGEQMPSLDALVSEIKTLRASKQAKAKEAKSETPKTPKAKVTDADTLQSILTFLNALDFMSIKEGSKEEALILEIHSTLEYKATMAE